MIWWGAAKIAADVDFGGAVAFAHIIKPKGSTLFKNVRMPSSKLLGKANEESGLLLPFSGANNSDLLDLYSLLLVVLTCRN